MAQAIRKVLKSRNDEGASAVEYIGAIIIAALIVGAIAAGVGDLELGDKLETAVDKVMEAGDE